MMVPMRMASASLSALNSRIATLSATPRQIDMIELAPVRCCPLEGRVEACRGWGGARGMPDMLPVMARLRATRACGSISAMPITAHTRGLGRAAPLGR